MEKVGAFQNKVNVRIESEHKQLSSNTLINQNWECQPHIIKWSAFKSCTYCWQEGTAAAMETKMSNEQPIQIGK